MQLFDVYPLFDINVVKGKGCKVWDDKGQEYLDLYGGHAVISIGHSHPHYIEVLTDQLSKIGFYSNSVRNPLQEELATRLGSACGLEDYSLFLDIPRPGHADFTAEIKYESCQDPRGGGHFSGRLTLPIVAAGVVGKMILEDSTCLDDFQVTGDSISARIIELGGIPRPKRNNQPMPDVWKTALDEAIREGDSLGAVVECRVEGIDIGYGEPFWDSVESVISHAIFSIPGVRGIEFGDGFAAAAMKGSEHNDPIGPDGIPMKNGSGGVNGGISNGAPIVFRVAFKPTSSIRKEQETWNFETGRMEKLVVPGRHDVCFALRAPVVVEAMTAIALADLALIKN